MPARDVDQRLAALAARRHHLLHHEQLVAARLSRNAVRHRVDRGLLHRVHRGVYAWGRPDVPFPAPILAAVWSCWPHAYASGATALWLRGVVDEPAGEPLQVSVVGRQVRGPRAVRVHRRLIAAVDLERHLHVPTTSVARALLDYAAEATPDRLEQAVVESDIANLATRRDLEAVLRRHPGHRGVRRLRALVELDGAEGLTRSQVERQVRGMFRRARIAPPEVNRVRGGHRVDFAWPQARVVLEINGFATHGRRGQFERDHSRGLDLERTGWHVLHASARQVRDQSEAILATVATVLALRSADIAGPA